LAGSDRPDRYPLNRLSDMWTNSVGIVFGCFCLLIGVTPMLAVMQLLLCLGECMAHISSGVLVRRRLRSQGKRTIYNPGLFTVLCGYLPLAVLWILSFVMERAPAFFEVAGAVACFVVLMAVTLFLPEKLCKRKDTPYGFTWGRGYYEKFRSDTPRTE
ncbi:MAG: HXXEE domain-containing protein, partial [Eubacteriales bacterium]